MRRSQPISAEAQACVAAEQPGTKIMRTISLLRLGVLATSLLALQPALAEAAQPMVLTADQLDGIVAGLSITVDAQADATGVDTFTKATTKTKITQIGDHAIGHGIAIAVAKSSGCSSDPAICSASAVTSGSYEDGIGKVKTVSRTLSNGTKISITIVYASGKV